MTTKKPSKMAQLTNSIFRFKAQDIGTLVKAYNNIEKVNKEKYMASGVIITIQNLSGETIVEPVMISDGLSKETIDALKADIKATHDFRLSMNKI